MSTTPHTDLADLALALLRAGQSALEVRTLLCRQHGLLGGAARRVVRHAEVILSTPADAVVLAVADLRSGHTLATVRARLSERFQLDRTACSRVLGSAIAELIGDFELGVVDRYLEKAMRDLDDRSLSRKERGKREAHLQRVWQHYDSLSDADATPIETIRAAAKLDKLLALGWKARLPAGAFD